jgi:hypothetical protein
LNTPKIKKAQSAELLTTPLPFCTPAIVADRFIIEKAITMPDSASTKNRWLWKMLCCALMYYGAVAGTDAL